MSCFSADFSIAMATAAKVLKQLIVLGKELGYEGKALQTFVTEEREAAERTETAKKAAEWEAAEIATERDRAAEERREAATDAEKAAEREAADRAEQRAVERAENEERRKQQLV